MRISRRDFVAYCVGATGLGLTAAQIGRLKGAADAAGGKSVVWLQGSGCTGCSVSLLNRVSDTASPRSAEELLVHSIDLVYHPLLMAAAGGAAVGEAMRAHVAGDYILVVEGGVPMASGGRACCVWSNGGREVTCAEAVRELAPTASALVSVGTCAAWGGVSAAQPNPTGVVGVSVAAGRDTINVAGCPPHPDWIVWTLVQLLSDTPMALDRFGRPRALFGRSVHDDCPFRDEDDDAEEGEDRAPPGAVAQTRRQGKCTEDAGCRGEEARGACGLHRWNGGVNWCVGAGAVCIGCTEPTFPEQIGLREVEDED